MDAFTVHREISPVEYARLKRSERKRARPPGSRRPPESGRSPESGRPPGSGRSGNREDQVN
jgi:hypothetical protein